MANPSYESILRIMKLPPENRPVAEIEHLLPWFKKKLFQKISREPIVDIIKNCEFTTCNKDVVIIRQGDKGDCFYILLNGTVAIHVNTTYADEDADVIRNKQIATEEHAKKGNNLDRSLYGIQVAKFESGANFGELALINPDCIRNASIISNESVDLLVVDRDLYDRSLKEFQARELREKKQFVEKFPLFANWNPKYKNQMTFSLRRSKVKFEQTIVKQGQPIDGLIFLISGQARITVEPGTHAIQYPDYYPLVDIKDLEKEEAIENFRREMNMRMEKKRSNNQEKRFGTNAKSVVTTSHPKHVQLCTVGGIEIIGDMELTLGLPTHNATVECTEEGSVLVLNQRNYDRLVDKRNPQSIDMLREIVHTKLTLRVFRFPDGYVPLLRYFLYKLDERERKLKQDEQEKLMAKLQVAPVKQEAVDPFPKGPLIDMFGPGSVFHVIRKREQAKIRKQMWNKNHRSPAQIILRGALQVGLSKAAGLLPNISGVQNNMGVMNGFSVVENEVTSELQGDGNGMHPVCMKVPCSEEESEGDDVDNESADAAMTRLEGRIDTWHHSCYADSSSNKSSFHSIKLHRFSPEESRKPMPGTKIMLKKKKKRKQPLEDSEQSEERSSMTDEFKNISKLSERCQSAGPIRTQPEIINSETGGRASDTAQRPSSYCKPVFKIKRGRSAKHYTVEEYELLRDELRMKQKTFKSVMYNRPSTAI